MPRDRGRRAGGRGRREGRGIQQLPWLQVRNPYPPIEVLSEEQLERVHDTSMRVLEEIGIEFMDARALDLLADTGADVDKESGVVRFDRDLVLELVA
ncbi:MAG: trimethylamine methyltransferase family protein, partial [Rhodovibrionaceae bacterium]|nr:trimethylamine methyltransferase family protein [Rhodovibrionaceae bacterium]